MKSVSGLVSEEAAPGHMAKALGQTHRDPKSPTAYKRLPRRPTMSSLPSLVPGSHGRPSPRPTLRAKSTQCPSWPNQMWSRVSCWCVQLPFIEASTTRKSLGSSIKDTFCLIPALCSQRSLRMCCWPAGWHGMSRPPVKTEEVKSPIHERQKTKQN